MRGIRPKLPKRRIAMTLITACALLGAAASAASAETDEDEDELVGRKNVEAASNADSQAEPGTAGDSKDTAEVSATLELASGAPSGSPSDEADQVTLPGGRVLLDVTLAANLSQNASLKPVSVGPDLWYGATDDLTVGLVHSSRGATGFAGGVGDALCLTGKARGCGTMYPSAGIDVRYGLDKGSFAFGLTGGLYARHIDPFQLAAKIGSVFRLRSANLVVEMSPNLFVGLTNRSPPQMDAVVVTANEETMHVPITLLYSLASSFAISGQSGAVIPFGQTGDTYTVPLSFGAHVSPVGALQLSLLFTMPMVLGGSAVDAGARQRSLSMGGSYAF
jgi:hypothetical protein